MKILSTILLFSMLILNQNSIFQIGIVTLNPINNLQGELSTYKVVLTLKADTIKRIIGNMVIIEFPKQYQLEEKNYDIEFQVEGFSIKKHFRVLLNNRLGFQISLNHVFSHKYLQKLKTPLVDIFKVRRRLTLKILEIRNPQTTLTDTIRARLYSDKEDDNKTFSFKMMKQPFVFDFEQQCRFALRGFRNQLFKISMRLPSVRNVKIKIHTDYDNYVKISPKVITFEKGMNKNHKFMISVGLSQSYQLNSIKFKTEILEGNMHNFDLQTYGVDVLNTFNHQYDSVNPLKDEKGCYPKVHIHPNNIYVPRGVISFPIELRMSHPYFRDKQVKNPLLDIKDNKYFDTFPKMLTFDENKTQLVYIKIKEDFHHMEFDLNMSFMKRETKFYDEAFLDFFKLKDLVDKNVEILENN